MPESWHKSISAEVIDLQDFVRLQQAPLCTKGRWFWRAMQLAATISCSTGSDLRILSSLAHFGDSRDPGRHMQEATSIPRTASWWFLLEEMENGNRMPAVWHRLPETPISRTAATKTPVSPAKGW